MKLSVIVPSIRPQNLQKLYDSIGKAFSGTWEMIVVGPYDLPDSLKGTENIQYIQDWGSPIRAQQMGLMESAGEYISWCADDGVCFPGSYDEAFRLLEDEDYKTVIMGKYQEGDRKDDHMEKNDYYILNNHFASNCSFIPDNCYMLNCGVISRKILFELGGWDAEKFQVCPMAYNDLAIRLQKYGCKFIVQESIMFECSHMPGYEGDHKPIHDGQVLYDEPMFKEIYNHPYWSKRMAIDINNWAKAPVRWKRRFGV